MKYTTHYNLNKPDGPDLFNVEHFNENSTTIDEAMYGLSQSIAPIDGHINNHNNPHQVTKAQVGLGNVDNTSDLNKPVSTAVQTELNKKMDIASLATVATTGAYNDLTGRPVLGSAAEKNVPTSGDATSSQVVMGNDSRLSDARPASDVSAWAKESTKPTYTASEVGAIPTTEKGANNGVAELDANGQIPSTQLPSYVDDVIEGYYNTTDGKFYEESTYTTEITGETGKIYVSLDTNKTYRWSGSVFVEISESLALGETSGTAYRGDRGKVAYDHATDANRITTATASGLYKVASTAEGHIADLTAVVKADITALGIPGSDTTYQSKPAAQGGTDESLVTTGEKYTWNNKAELTDIPGVMTGATSQADGEAGLVPKPTSADASKVLFGNGTWDALPSGVTQLSGLSDVNVGSQTDGQALVWDVATSKWVNDDVTITVDAALDSTSENPVQNKVIYSALDDKVDVVSGKGLSTEDYTAAEKTKLAGIATGAEVNVQSNWNETDTTSDAYIANKPSIPTNTSDLTNDSDFVVDANYTHITVDSALSSSSENPVQNKVINTALAGKIGTSDYATSNDFGIVKVDGTTITASNGIISSVGSGAGGHTIEDSNGTAYAQRSSLKFTNATISDDSVNDATVVTPGSTNFVGTYAQWNALTPAEQATYETRDITDDYSGSPIDSVPTQNSINAVQSGGVYTAIQNAEVIIAGIEATSTASQAYVIGQYLIYGNVLYVVTASISQGDTLTAGTNISATTVGSQLTSMRDNLTASNQTAGIINVPFRFGVDDDGNFGYIITEGGADTVIPFKSGSGAHTLLLTLCMYSTHPTDNTWSHACYAHMQVDGVQVAYCSLGSGQNGTRTATYKLE